MTISRAEMSEGAGRLPAASDLTRRLDELAELARRHPAGVTVFDEGLAVAPQARELDFDRLKRQLWIPLAVGDGRAEVAAANPWDAGLEREIKDALQVEEVRFRAALPEDVQRLIEHARDINPNFPACAGRTVLARVRTYLALRRSQFSAYRTKLSRGRTGLAFLRTGLSFCTATLVLIRVFGLGWLLIPEILLALLGLSMTVDGFRWYWDARGIARKQVAVPPPDEGGGVSVLEVESVEERPTFRRTAPIPGAEELREGWSGLSPVMRRRFLAMDRTDLAEERTRLAAYRSVLAKARTGLALTRTGIALVGVGSALLRSKGFSGWVYADSSPILVGLIMIFEGFHWYIPGRRIGKGGLRAIVGAGLKASAWDLVLPRRPKPQAGRSGPGDVQLMGPEFHPGIFSTTGLGLERTVLAERRNVMARFRTVLARSRTGMSLIRTGMNFTAVGLGLMVAYGTGSAAWTVLALGILAMGLFLVTDGHYWYLPAAHWKRQFPYCDGELDIYLPDYGQPYAQWDKVVFDDDE